MGDLFDVVYVGIEFFVCLVAFIGVWLLMFYEGCLGDCSFVGLQGGLKWVTCYFWPCYFRPFRDDVLFCSGFFLANRRHFSMFHWFA